MSMLTKYHNMSNNDLLRVCRYGRNYSPIIEELCQRLENCQDNQNGYTGTECPACEAALTVSFDGSEFGVEIA